jgi:hypothetical protein
MSHPMFQFFFENSLLHPFPLKKKKKTVLPPRFSRQVAECSLVSDLYIVIWCQSLNGSDSVRRASEANIASEKINATNNTPVTTTNKNVCGREPGLSAGEAGGLHSVKHHTSHPECATAVHGARQRVHPVAQRRQQRCRVNARDGARIPRFDRLFRRRPVAGLRREPHRVRCRCDPARAAGHAAAAPGAPQPGR